jgi:hypothetical protein
VSIRRVNRQGRYERAAAPAAAATSSEWSGVGRERGYALDVIVTPSEDHNAWQLADLLGRSMGAVVETSAAEFRIEPDGHALQTIARIERGPYD